MWKNMNKIAKLLFFLLLINLFLFPLAQIEANQETALKYNVYLDKSTIAKGYTVSSFNDSIKLSLVPGILNQSTEVEVEKITDKMPTPWNLKRVSPIYQFEFKNKQAYNHKKPFYIQFSYNQDSLDYKKVFFYDKNYQGWRPLPTQDHPEHDFVRSLIHLPFAKIAVFSVPGAMIHGKASWYGYKGGDFAASPDFPKGSRIRVFNTSNNKFVDVEINDFGPDRNIFPNRAIDLDKAAFNKIAGLGEGVIDVKLQPLHITNEEDVLGLEKGRASIKPEITAKSGAVISESSGEVLWQHNAESVLPLASLTKLVAIKVFIDQNPTLTKEVTYQTKDEEYNYQFCNKWESVKVKLKQGDKVTMEDLIYSSLVGSANNAIETLVRNSGLSRNAFVEKMNQQVKEWGAKSTHFVEPSGLSPDNVSSARDYAIITKEIFKNPLIKKISTTPDYTFYTINTKEKHYLKNTSELIKNNYFSTVNNIGIIGSKTGYLHEAGYCLMTRAENSEGKKVISVVLGAGTRSDSFEDSKKLIKYGLSLD